MAKNKKTGAKAAKKKPATAKPLAKKSPAKKAAPAKKVVAKKVAAKKAAPAKKVVAKKVAAKKAAPAKKVVAKKVAPAKKVAAPAKKVAEPVKKVVAKPTPVAPAKKVASKKVAKEKTASPKKGEVTNHKPVANENVVTITPSPKPTHPQLTNFPVPNQRPIAHKPATVSTSQVDRTRYSEEELVEFETLINQKLEKAREEYKILKETLNRNNDEGTDATSGGNTKVLEDGAETAEKENLSQLAARQQKYITNLENALIRIKNGTYGICSVTGKLIPRERLIAVPHTTQSIEAKMMNKD
jgi:RNA polymerase-binding transcription factor DksA